MSYEDFDANDVCPLCKKEMAMDMTICEECELTSMLDNGMDKERMEHNEYWIAPNETELQSAGYKQIADGDYDYPIPQTEIDAAFRKYKKVIYICTNNGWDYDSAHMALWVKEPKRKSKAK